MANFPWIPCMLAALVALLVVCCAQHHQYLYGMVDGYYSPQASNFEPMSAGGESAQPAAVDTDVLAAASRETQVAQLAHPVGHSQQVLPSDMLPKTVETAWLRDSKVAALTMPNLAAPDFRTGRDMIGQSLKNPNLQIRPDPPIGRSVDTGIFNQSIIEPDRQDKSQLAIRCPA